MNRLLPVLLALLLCGGCVEKEVAPVEMALGTAAPTAHAASCAMLAVAGDVFDCANVLQECTTFPCDVEVEVEVSDDCPLPLMDGADGTVVVEGTWTSADSATLSAAFAEVDVDDRGLVVVEAGAVNVTHDAAAGWTQVDYVDADIVVSDNREPFVGASAWSVDIDHAGSPDDPEDDVYVIDGASVVLVDSKNRDVFLSGVTLDPSCHQNPVSGDGTMNTINGARITTYDIEFHDACDGTFEVRKGGNPAMSVGLDLLD